MTDNVSHPSHYNAGKIEVIDAIEDWKLGFHLGNVVKYIARAAHKGAELEDLKKAKWYLERKIQQLEGGNARQPKERDSAKVASRAKSSRNRKRKAASMRKCSARAVRSRDTVADDRNEEPKAEKGAVLQKEEWIGADQPDEFKNPIEYRLWFEANICDLCRGSMKYNGKKCVRCKGKGAYRHVPEKRVHRWDDVA